jgi:hypothetical protein
MLSFLLVVFSKVIDQPKWSCVCGQGRIFGHRCHDVMSLRAEGEKLLPIHKRVAALREIA